MKSVLYHRVILDHHLELYRLCFYRYYYDDDDADNSNGQFGQYGETKFRHAIVEVGLPVVVMKHYQDMLHSITFTMNASTPFFS